MKAMREALTKVSEWMAHRIATGGFEASPTIPTVLEDVVLPALARPARNCDVGTAEEQIKRWEKFCLEHHEYWKPSKSLTAIQRCSCPCSEGNGCNFFIWAQMPYDEKGGSE